MMAWHTKNTDLFIVLQEQNWATRQTTLMLLLNVLCVCVCVCVGYNIAAIQKKNVWLFLWIWIIFLAPPHIGLAPL